jgi:hypothetical protein
MRKRRGSLNLPKCLQAVFAVTKTVSDGKRRAFLLPSGVFANCSPILREKSFTRLTICARKDRNCDRAESL